jgi:sodium pump decarboxylase gamma subunit
MGTEVNTLSGALGEGLQVTVIGLVIVFSVLIILMLVLMAMKAIFYKSPEKQQTAEAPAGAATAENKKAASMPDDEELIAVLTAAVAASLNTSTYNLKIKSYRRVGNNAPAWNKAGLEENINSRF